jgi:hypothetical protein
VLDRLEPRLRARCLNSGRGSREWIELLLAERPDPPGLGIVGAKHEDKRQNSEGAIREHHLAPDIGVNESRFEPVGTFIT